MVIFNNGGKATVIRNLQCRFSKGTGQVMPLPWRNTCGALPSESTTELPNPFAIAPRDAMPIIVEFGGPFPGLLVEPEKDYSLEIEVLTAHREKWQALVKFDIRTPRYGLDKMTVHQLTHDEETAARASRSVKGLLETLQNSSQEHETGSDGQPTVGK
jgi:hypothetical protein